MTRPRPKPKTYPLVRIVIPDDNLRNGAGLEYPNGMVGKVVERGTPAQNSLVLVKLFKPFYPEFKSRPDLVSLPRKQRDLMIKETVRHHLIVEKKAAERFRINGWIPWTLHWIPNHFLQRV